MTASESLAWFILTAGATLVILVDIRPGTHPAEVTLIDTSADAGPVVVGTRGRGAFAGMLLGSVSHAVMHGARCAVAVV